MKTFTNINRTPKGSALRVMWFVIHLITFTSIFAIIYLALAGLGKIPFNKETVLRNALIFSGVLAVILSVIIFVMSSKGPDYRVTSENVEFVKGNKVTKVIPLSNTHFTASTTVVYSLIPNHNIHCLIADTGKHKKSYRIRLLPKDFDEFFAEVQTSANKLNVQQ